jgi:hypothetical protein
MRQPCLEGGDELGAESSAVDHRQLLFSGSRASSQRSKYRRPSIRRCPAVVAAWSA